MQVLVRDNNVDQALKALKKKMQREGIFREMKLRGHYEKPSEKKAREKAEAIRRARKLARKKMQREGLLADEAARGSRRCRRPRWSAAAVAAAVAARRVSAEREGAQRLSNAMWRGPSKARAFFKPATATTEWGSMPIKSKYLFVASMDVDPDKEALFNEVYDTEHVPNLLKVPGVHSVNRMEGEPFAMSIGGAGEADDA